MAILAALGLLNANDPLRAVDTLDLQPDHLASAQAAAIAETEQHARLRPWPRPAGAGVSSGLITCGILLRLAEAIDLGEDRIAAVSRATRTALRS